MFGLHASRLASGSDDLDVIVWDWQRRRKVLRYNSGHSANIFQAKFLPFAGDTHIVSTSRDGQVKLTKSSNSPQSRLQPSSLLRRFGWPSSARRASAGPRRNSLSTAGRSTRPRSSGTRRTASSPAARTASSFTSTSGNRGPTSS